MPTIGTTVQNVSLRASQLKSCLTPTESWPTLDTGGAVVPATAASARKTVFSELVVLAKPQFSRNPVNLPHPPPRRRVYPCRQDQSRPDPRPRRRPASRRHLCPFSSSLPIQATA